jgi:hypothetical protein
LQIVAVHHSLKLQERQLRVPQETPTLVLLLWAILVALP